MVVYYASRIQNATVLGFSYSIAEVGVLRPKKVEVLGIRPAIRDLDRDVARELTKANLAASRGIKMGLFAGTKWDVPNRCERCEKLESECTCPPLEEQKVWMDPSKQTARVILEKRKKGKVVSVVRGLLAKDNDLPSLLTKLKNSCGAGGTIDSDSLEIQGDHVSKIQSILKELGYRIGK